MDKATILFYAVCLMAIIECIFSIIKAYNNSQKESIIDRFLNVIPAIDKGLKEFAVIYKKSATEDHMIELAVDFIYDIIADNTQLDEKFPSVVNKVNVEKYVYPVFKKIYATELKK